MSRFKELEAKLAAKGATDPGGLAAFIGKKKYGHAGFKALQAEGRAKKHLEKKVGDGSKSDDEKRSEFEWLRADTEYMRRERIFAITDAHVRSDGDGRTVEAYCAAFGVPAKINDQDGRYNEVLTPTSFDRTIAHKGTRFGVFYNHAKTIYGTPDGALSVPIAVPVEAPKPDGYGVMTVSRYLDDNPLADLVLSAIKQKALAGQSFSGRFVKSQRTRSANRDSLPTITRSEVDMREYGPTPFPAYVEAKITGTRSADAYLHDLISMDRDERADLFARMLAIAAPLATPAEPVREVITVTAPRADTVASTVRADEIIDTDGQNTSTDSTDTAAVAPVGEQATSTVEPGQDTAEDSPSRHSARQADLARRIRVALITRGVR